MSAIEFDWMVDKVEYRRVELQARGIAFQLIAISRTTIADADFALTGFVA